MQKGFYNRVMTSNRVLNSSKTQPVIQPAKINNGEKLQFVNENVEKNVEKNVFHNEVKENISFSSSLLENRVNNLENIIQALLSKNIEIENKLSELESSNTKNEEVENHTDDIVQVEKDDSEAHFELNEFDKVELNI
jgi:response regulator RpfG family c-di-GMP phosphodiesterase